MAEGMNRVTLIGHIGQDPELRYTQSGTAVLNVRMATTEGYKDNNGEWKQRTEWHTVVVWGKRAEGLKPHLSKGSCIGVEGRLQTRTWEAKDGGKRYATEVVADRVLLLGPAHESKPAPREPGQDTLSREEQVAASKYANDDFLF